MPTVAFRTPRALLRTPSSHSDYQSRAQHQGTCRESEAQGSGQTREALAPKAACARSPARMPTVLHASTWPQGSPCLARLSQRSQGRSQGAQESIGTFTMLHPLPRHYLPLSASMGTDKIVSISGLFRP